jgi:CRISPR system Cascade subunit CasD
MESWGGISVGYYRPTETRPTKSAIAGILSAAMGLERYDQRIGSLFTDFDYAIASAGKESKMLDYHTIETSVPGKDSEITNVGPRPTELRRDWKLRNTILSEREYICNGYYTVFMIQKQPSFTTLENMRDSLVNPTYAPYLGRKSCPLSFPMMPEIVDYRCFSEAVVECSLKPFLSADFHESEFLKRTASLHIYATFPMEGAKELAARVMHDDTPSHGSWQFYDRKEYEYVVER